MPKLKTRSKENYLYSSLDSFENLYQQANEIAKKHGAKHFSKPFCDPLYSCISNKMNRVFRTRKVIPNEKLSAKALKLLDQNILPKWFAEEIKYTERTIYVSEKYSDTLDQREEQRAIRKSELGLMEADYPHADGSDSENEISQPTQSKIHVTRNMQKKMLELNIKLEEEKKETEIFSPMTMFPPKKRLSPEEKEKYKNFNSLSKRA